jgi:predicted pyridoxine 5'-phosphate oxidase superfamily flavin-nucleotide-binding protein
VTFHPGERNIQARAGVRAATDKVGRIIHDQIPEAAADFLEQQRMLVLSHRDDAGRVRASLLSGRPGFARVVDPRTLEVEGPTPPSGSAGVLAIDFARRFRMRLNGTLEARPGGFRIRAEQVYANCPKYIQSRSIVGEQPPGTARIASALLSASQQEQLRRADTFFIATAPKGQGADASHRGGNPGFVRVIDGRRIEWDDYLGNAMFNTLGNLDLDPEAALLFVGFDAGTLIHLNGRARVEGDRQRRVIFEVDAVEETAAGSPYRWTPADYSPFNPR